MRAHATWNEFLVSMLWHSSLIAVMAFALVACGGGGGGSGSGIPVPLPDIIPVINAQPTTSAVDDGQTANFSVAAVGPNLRYQWRRNGSNIAGATTPNLQLTAVALGDTGSQFDVVVSNGAGSVTSNPATLTVRAVAARVVTQPLSTTVGVGASAFFEVVASGSPPLSYQWRKNGTPIPGATGATYTTPPLGLADSGALFTVQVSNSAGNDLSTDAILTVQPLPPVAASARLTFGVGHVVARKADGSVLAWGDNTSGQSGSGAAIVGTNARSIPTTAISIAAGSTESLAVGNDGVVRGWGRKFARTTIIGGDAATNGTDVPTPSIGGWPSGISQVAMGSSERIALGLRDDGTVWHMPGIATNISGGLNQTARQVPGLPQIAALGRVVATDGIVMAVDGTIWRITFTATGGGGTNPISTVTQANGVPGTISAVCNSIECIALNANGSVRPLSFVAGAVPPGPIAGLPQIAQIAATATTFLALSRNGQLWQWFSGGVPASVPGLSGIAEVAGGLQTVLVRLNDGTVWGYGSNIFGELGATNPVSSTVVQVPGINLN